MATLKIYTYPDEVLAKVAKPINTVLPKHRKLAQDMLDTMYAAPGIGLAANQVGILERIIVVDVDYDYEEVNEEDQVEHPPKIINANPIVFINPEIIKSTGEAKISEGCLSVPDTRAEVDRFSKITVRYLDLEGHTQECDADGLLAICLQHEIDHLNGVLFIERLGQMKKEMIQKKLIKDRKFREMDDQLAMIESDRAKKLGRKSDSL